MTTGLERIAEKARKETNFRFTSLAHHITEELVWESLNHISPQSAPGVDGQTVDDAKKNFTIWIERMLASIHRKGYNAPAVRRVYIPKPGKNAKRPLGVPCVADRALQRSVALVLNSIYEQDFLSCSFGGRPNVGQHKALATLNEVIAGKKVGWVLEADLKNFFGSLDHGWLLQFVEHRVGDPRIISLIRRWLKAGVFEDGSIRPSDEGTPQGGSVSVLLSNVYLHYVLDLWFAKVVRPRLRGEAYLIRYIDDFVVCFQYRADAKRFESVLTKRLAKFSLSLEPSKTKLVEFGRFAAQHSQERKRKLETIYFLGFTHFCTRNRKGNFMVGRKTEKTRLNRSLGKLKELMRDIRYWSLKDQAMEINQVLRGHYNYYGLAGNFHSLARVYRFTERYWHKMLCSRSQKSYIKWEDFHKIKVNFPLQRPKLHLSYEKFQAYVVL